MNRFKYMGVTAGETEFSSSLSYMLKTPLFKAGADVVNSLGRWRNALKTFLKSWRVIPTCFGSPGFGELALLFSSGRG